MRKAERAVLGSGCPKCGKEISKLVNWSRAWVKYWFDGEDYIDGGDSHPDYENEYCCPECGEVLFHDEDEARKFLKQ